VIAPPDRTPRMFVLQLDELTAERVRFVHISPADGTRAGVELGLMRDEWERMGRPSSLRVELAP